MRRITSRYESRSCCGRKSRITLADDRRAPEPAAHQHFEPEFTSVIALQVQADVVHLRGRPVGRRAGDSNLELAGQIREFRMQRRPLPHDLAIRSRIIDLIGRHARKVIGRDVAHAVAAGLHRVHLDLCQLGQDVGHQLELRPVELQVLPRREVAIAAIVGSRDWASVRIWRTDSSPYGIEMRNIGAKRWM